MSNLTLLDVSQCPLIHIPNIHEATHLTYLMANQTKLTDIPLDILSIYPNLIQIEVEDTPIIPNELSDSLFTTRSTLFGDHKLIIKGLSS